MDTLPPPKVPDYDHLDHSGKHDPKPSDAPSIAQPRLKVEVCCFSISAAQLAAETGVVDRIELCMSRETGGLSPWELLFPIHIAELSRINSLCAVRVMVRPRSGHFVYDINEFCEMRNQIQRSHYLKGRGSNKVASGFVFGILTREGKVDVPRCKVLVDDARELGLQCTFHMAFDVIDLRYQFDALEDIISCGFDALLTSGCSDYRNHHLESLEELVRLSSGRLKIIAGRNVRSENIKKVAETGVGWFHSSAITDGSEYPSADEIRALRDALPK